MRTILFKIDDGYFVRNFLRTDAFTILRSLPDVRMVFLAPQEKLEYYASEFPPDDRMIFDILPRIEHDRSERFFRFIEVSSIHSHTVTAVQRTDFVRTRGQKLFVRRVFSYALKRFFWNLGRFGWWRKMIRYSYFLVPSHTYDDFFEKYKPDLVYGALMMKTDFRFLKEARKRGIKTLGMILSWDSLHSKTFARVFPDWLIVQTDDIRRQAVRYADYPEERIVVSGIPQYDRYFRRTGIVERKAFIESIGGDPAKKLIVYAISGKAGLFLDTDIILFMSEAIKKGDIEEHAQILLRPYPRYDIMPQKIKALADHHGILSQSSMMHIGTGKNNWEFDEASLSLLSNTLAHADVVVALYTTFFIEAAIFDKPLIAVGFDERHTSYWDSAKRFFEWDHLRELDELKGILRVDNRKELIDGINMFLKNPDRMHEGRDRIVKRQSQFTDGRSGERLARIFLKVLEIPG